MTRPWRPTSNALLLSLLLSLLAACGGGGSSDGTSVPPGGPVYNNPTVYSAAAAGSLASATEAAAVTSHSLTLAGGAVAYSATAGHLTASDRSTGSPRASMFYVAYTVDGASAATRPVVYFFNGGPGSASVWLHLGSFAPRRIVTRAPLTTIPQPFELTDNLESLIDVADLVFVDAVGTGFSQAIAPARNQDFWSVGADAAVMRDFIGRYAAANGRSRSPTYVFGESYGTTRAAVLANLMVSAGMQLDGVILQSSILDYNSNCAVFSPGQLSCAGFLPSYGLSGAWFELTQPLQPDPDSFAARLRDFSAVTYAPAVAAFIGSGVLPAASVLDELVDLTGAALVLWTQKFDLDPASFRSALLPAQLIGRYDARVVAPVGSVLASEGDPSSTVLTGPFTAGQRDHLRNELGYRAASTYTMFSNDSIDRWSFAHDGRALPDTIPDLATALAQRPALRILSLSGYHDLATPFYQTELDLARLGNVPGLQVAVYPGGHMTYLDDRSRPRMKADIAAFINLSAP